LGSGGAACRKEIYWQQMFIQKNTNVKGKVDKYKAWLVENGYSQVPRIDFGDIFSPTTEVTSIRLLLFIAYAFDFEVG